MANLFVINKAIIDAWDAAVDPETGEVSEEALKIFEDLQMERDQKIESIGCWIKNLTSDADALNQEASNMKERAKAAEKKAQSLKRYLAAALNGEKFQTPKVAISWRKTAHVEVEDVESLPQEYQRVKTTVEADKTAIKDAIKAGAFIEGCQIVESNVMSIK